MLPDDSKTDVTTYLCKYVIPTYIFQTPYKYTVCFQGRTILTKSKNPCNFISFQLEEEEDERDKYGRGESVDEYVDEDETLDMLPKEVLPKLPKVSCCEP